MTETGGGGGVQVVRPGSGEGLDVFGAAMVVKSDGSGMPLFVGEHVVPPGYAVPPHLHEGEDEAFYVLAGELTLWCEAGETKAGPGAFARLPRGVRHGFRNDTGGEVRFLVISQPGVQAAEMFRHLDRAGRAAAPGGPAPDEIVAICGQYGVRMG